MRAHTVPRACRATKCSSRTGRVGEALAETSTGTHPALLTRKTRTAPGVSVTYGLALPGRYDSPKENKTHGLEDKGRTALEFGARVYKEGRS